MTSTNARPPAEAGGVCLADPAEVTIDAAADWGGARRVMVRRGGSTVFACSVAPRGHQLWSVTGCLPQRSDPDLADMLLRVCDWLAAEYRATRIVAIGPVSWEQRLAAAGARLLQRVVPMGLTLDEEVLLMHGTPLARTLAFAPLDAPAVDALWLSRLGPEADRDGELAVWREIFSGDHGPLVPEASLRVLDGSRLSAVIAVTEYRGRPLVANIVTAEADRGRGLGRAVLVESLLRLARAGYVDCRLNVVEDNWIAHRLYRSVGFVQDQPTLRASIVTREQAPS